MAQGISPKYGISISFEMLAPPPTENPESATGICCVTGVTVYRNPESLQLLDQTLSLNLPSMVHNVPQGEPFRLIWTWLDIQNYCPYSRILLDTVRMCHSLQQDPEDILERQLGKSTIFIIQVLV